jgi:hypothetical protein
MDRTIIAGLIGLSVVIAGCSGQQSSSGGPAGGATAGTVANPTDFPLSPDAKILAAKPFNQTVDVTSSGGGTLMSQGKGTYVGHSVIAEGGGSIGDAKAWLAKTEAAPPHGYTRVVTADSAKAIAVASKYGVTYGVFRNGSKGAVIAVIDTKVAHDKLGFLIGLADKYRMLPESMRGPIDDQVKQRLGMSVTEALDPSAPVGMTLEALRTINSSDKPAIVELDAAKQ